MRSFIKRFGVCLLVPTLAVAIANALFRGFFDPYLLAVWAGAGAIWSLVWPVFSYAGSLLEGWLFAFGRFLFPEQFSYLIPLSVCAWIWLVSSCVYPRITSPKIKRRLLDASYFGAVLFVYVAMNFAATAQVPCFALFSLFGALGLLGLWAVFYCDFECASDGCKNTQAGEFREPHEKADLLFGAKQAEYDYAKGVKNNVFRDVNSVSYNEYETRWGQLAAGKASGGNSDVE